MGFFKKLDRASGLIGSMAETLHANLGQGLAEGRITGQDMRNAVMACMGCEGSGDCANWLSDHPEGAKDTPDYCRNRSMLHRLRVE